MDEVIAAIFVLVLLVLAAIGFVSLWKIGDEREATMREAFERGYAVQCIGREGYFWECEKEKPND